MSPSTKPGLRERKKARTRAAIQHEALALFRRHGYPATTIEQICEAAEVSQSTFFRYFPTKEAVVLSDDYDPLIAEAFRAQPARLGTVQALRRAIGSVFEPLGAEEMADMRERAVLSMQVPEVWGAALVNMMETGQLLADLVAERLGRKATDMRIQSFAGAVVGVMMAQLRTWADHPDIDVAASIDNALAFLEQGLPIDRTAR
jgi:AcrR family transcriptional regulator